MVKLDRREPRTPLVDDILRHRRRLPVPDYIQRLTTHDATRNWSWLF